VKALALLGVLLLAFSLVFIEPPGPVFLSEANSCGDMMKVQVPEYLREKGYPRVILVDRRYVYENWGYAWKQFLNDTFRVDGVYDHRRGRILSPEEASYLVVGCVESLEVNWGKTLFFVFGVGFTVAGLVSPSGGGRREESRPSWREVGGMG